jgi:GR25 family glycosyltransferase involved in LPS biosynthesis
MLPTARKQLYLLGIFVVVVLWLQLGQLRHNLPMKTWSSRNVLSVYNRTLGFERVFVIGMPKRSDKRDRITVASSLTGFDVTFVPGVAPEDVAKQAAPPTWDYDQQTFGALGAWRAHMNVMQQIVADGITSALIFEDDADWDVTFKSQLEQFARGIHEISRSASTANSPYGSDWDLLWPGHCRIGVSNKLQDFYISPEDPTVPPIAYRRAKWRQTHVPEQVLQNYTRLYFQANGGMCLTGYAVTLAGARKFLSSVSLTSQNQPVDVSMNAMCRGRLTQPFTCYAPYPPLVGTHRAAGPQSRDSDINNVTGEWHDMYTFDIVYSTMQNVPRLVSDSQTVTAQYLDGVLRPEISRDWKVGRGFKLRMALGEMPESVVNRINAN